ncbi:MAG: nucleotidyl transferase AbiEii/AbiGii toxin family protein [Holdemanella porci]|nr:nucleotidyl transferase AbiEii/AbiGii toxin family protein [Holdemanella porci]
MISAASIKSRLKNIAIKENSTMQNELVTYALERTIYRMSISKYSDNFTLKGGIFLYALFNRQYPRATMDIDFLANKIANDSEFMKEVFTEIFLIQCDDALFFDLSSLKVENITEFKEYHGVNVSILALLEKTKIPVSIDIGFGDIVYPDRIKMDFPVLLDMEIPSVNAYSIYSAIAEKFEAIVSLGRYNSRYKDFYDIYAISQKHTLNGSDLYNALVETFNHRNTSFNNIVAFSDDFINDPSLDKKWKSFKKKKQVNQDIDFKTVITHNMKVLLPVVDAILNEQTFKRKWNATLKDWED